MKGKVVKMPYKFLAILSLALGALISLPTHAETTGEKGVEYPGPREFMECQSLLNKDEKWADLSQNQDTSGDIWSSSWEKIDRKMTDLGREVEGIEYETLRKGGDTLLSLEGHFQELLQEIENHYRQLKTCEAAIHATKDSPYDKSQFGRNYTKKSSDEALVCQSKGIYTQDYKMCSEIIEKYEMAKVGEKGMQTVQQINMQEHMNDEKNKLSQDPNAATNALEAQKSAVSKSADQANQRAVFHATKAGVLYNYLSKMPTVEDIHNTCTQTDSSHFKKIHEHYTNALQRLKRKGEKLNNKGEGETFFKTTRNESRSLRQRQSLGNSTVEPIILSHPMYGDNRGKSFEGEKNALANSCNELVYQKEIRGIAMNQQTRDRVKQLLMKAGVDLAAEKMKANMYDDQADQIGDSIDKVDDYEPNAPQVEYEDAKAKACEVNPMHPSCQEEGREDVAYQGDSFQYEDSGSGMIASGATADDSSSSNDSGSSGSDGRVPSSGVASPIDPVNQEGGFESSPPAAGSSKHKDGNGGGGSGGGGGGAGGVGAPANGGARGKGQKRASGGGEVDVENPSYGGGGGSLAYGGGGGIGRTQDDGGRGDDNPFKKLFDKKKGGRDQVMNFRNPAQVGKKNGSLFEMISHRYKRVSEKDRLLEYERKGTKGDAAE